MSKNDPRWSLDSSEIAAGGHRWPNLRMLALAGLWILLVGVLFVFSVWVELFEWLYEVTRAHEDWQLDEMLALLLCVGVVSLVFLAIRTRQLGHEIRRREAAERLAHDSARHDPLTGLANGRRFREALTLAIERASQSRLNCAVLFIDLDRFKPVNDMHGHAIGDEVLIDVAQQIAQAAPAGATAARLGGDEFGIVVPSVPGRESVLFLSQRLSRDIGKVRQVGERQLEVGATVGIAVFPDDGLDANALISAADQAMYAAKPSRRGLLGRGDLQGSAIAN
ncbi:MAG TPA: GGDEF domain-containing protein [Mesorhizobium sp.]|jgi:diguanylate cyclase (GGDEF)-like protein|uniref:GGDEF domain-containing protein n=1 Tax=Mesorhizobium sp. TaxID=1871066 RepID=UPI002DDD5D1F|nr:GGDEF domain-containing protein [Mesorhizobium sp.]HEV2501543.1 GGDEF domain-containing protein [Mesorhizobium sp.]